MTMMELLTIPGLDNSKRLEKLRRESKKRMNASLVAQRRAAAMMSARRRETK